MQIQNDYVDKTLDEIIDLFKKNQIYIDSMYEIINSLDGDDLVQAHQDLRVFIDDQLILGYEFLKRHI